MSVEIEVSWSGPIATEQIEAIVTSAVKATLAHRNVDDASISVTLLGDDEITELNREYLEHDRVTDVISFPLYDEDETPVGDVYIGYEQAKRQAEEAGVMLDNEIARLAVHGTLHVLGFDHPEDESRTDSEMWKVQEEILTKLS